MRKSVGVSLLALAILSLAWTQSSSFGEQKKQKAKKPTIEIKPEPYVAPDGKRRGWKVRIPGNRSLATPAVAGDKVFIGGGFGSHEFYAFDATTGKLAWRYQTADDGPTAAIVSDGRIIFNTESCELEVLDLAGKPVWKKWLGDPLMSMPAAAGGKVYMCYPDSRGDREHKLACFDLKTGNQEWAANIPGEIITAPVVEDGRVYLASVDGTIACFEAQGGKLVWSEKKNATSSPLVWNDRCYFSRRTEKINETKDGRTKAKQQTEQISVRGLTSSDSVKDLAETSRIADYLDYSKKSRSGKERLKHLADSGVGFGGSAKGDAKMGMAMANLGEASVCGLWSYQGSRPFIYRDKLYASVADKAICVDPKTEKVLWEKALHGGDKGTESNEVLDALVSPPALVNGKIFLGTDDGSLVCLSSETGERLWSVDLGEPITFQPAVAGGRVFVATSSGSLFCVETGDLNDDGWFMWGANAAHKGPAGSAER
jgi:Ca-activated chloride channel family protein